MIASSQPGDIPLDPHRLADGGYETVILAAPDLHGRLFGKRMSAAAFVQRLESGINASSCALAWDIEQDLDVKVEYTGFHTGWHDFVLRPDLSTLRPAGWLDGVALCIADIIEERGGERVPIAPRNILWHQVERLRDMGFEPIIGSELEFFLYRPGPEEAREADYRNLVPTTRVHADYLIGHGNALEPYFRQLRDGLATSGIEVELSHVEWGHGQWEMNLEYGPALATADIHAIFKLAVKDVAAAHGMTASFMSRPSSGDIGSSGHLHLSLRDLDGGYAFFDSSGERGMSDTLRWTTGGVLAHSPDVMLFYAPNVNSYRRVAREGLTAGSGCTWGYDNRTVSCRVIGHSPAALRLEWRVPGADVNPYLAVAAVLASAAEGIGTEADPGAPVLGNAYEAERRLLPSDLGAAIGCFRASETSRRWFGDLVVDHFAALADYEWTQFMGEVTEWEIRRYLEAT